MKRSALKYFMNICAELFQFLSKFSVWKFVQMNLEPFTQHTYTFLSRAEKHTHTYTTTKTLTAAVDRSNNFFEQSTVVKSFNYSSTVLTVPNQLGNAQVALDPQPERGIPRGSSLYFVMTSDFVDMFQNYYWYPESVLETISTPWIFTLKFR